MSKEALSKSCPDCQTPMSAEARFCINCRHDFSEPPRQPETFRPPPVAGRVCPKCKAGVGANAIFCGNCGGALGKQRAGQAESLPIIARAILAIVALAYLAVIIAGSDQPIVSFRERLLATIPGDPKPGSFPFLSFKRTEPKVAYSIKENDQSYVFDGERKLADFDSAERPVFSRDGSRFAYVAKDDRKSNNEFVVVDGKRGPAVESVSSLNFTSDGRLVYEGKVSDKWSLFVENEKGTTLDYIFYYLFARDGKTIAYLGRLGDKYLIVADGKQGELFDDVTYLTVSRYGTTVAYRAKQNGKWCVVVNGKKGPFFDSIEDGPVVSEDGSKVAYAGYESLTSSLSPQREYGLANIAYQSAAASPRKILMIGDKRQDLDSAATIYGLVFSPDASKVAYKVRKNNKYYVMNGESRSPEYDLITALTFAPDSSRVAYVAYQSGKGFVVVGDARGPSFDDAYSPYFSPDSSRIAYVARQADKRVMVVSRVDKLSPGFGNNVGPECDIVYPPIFSIDGSAVAYGAVQGKQVFWKVARADDDSQFLIDK